MKKLILTLSVMLTLLIFTKAQSSTERIYIKGGNNARENFMKEIYLYPSFEAGLVEYKNGKQYKSTLNYNRVLGSIEFIDQKGDTLSINDIAAVSRITVGNDVFFYAPDCMKEINSDGKLKLVKNERIRIADHQKIGGYGIPNSTASIESIDRIDTRITFNQLDINETLLLSKTTKFYLEKENNSLVPASKKNILNMFPKHKTAIRQYMEAHQINFSKENDLVELAGYISQL